MGSGQSLTALVELTNPIVLTPDVDRFFEALASKRGLRLEEANRYTATPVHPLRIVSELQKWLTDV